MRTQTSVEMFKAAPMISRAAESLQALARSVPSGLQLRQTTTYAGGSDWLLVWGPGEPIRAAAIRRQVDGGKHAIAIDCSYWSRNRKIRLTIDAPHPQALVMQRPLPASRFASDRPEIINAWKSDGPIIIAGIGCKARKQYGAETVSDWEDAMARSCRERFPGREIIRRPKKPDTVPIERALVGASLLITWHSNVAVDAIRMGIPVICKDGAAAAVCPSELPVSGELVPLSTALRDQFLANLAWFQWDLKTESAACWAFLRETLA